MESNISQCLATRRMTPQDVMAYLSDYHRQLAQFDCDAAPYVKHDLDTTIAQWRKDCGWVEWQRLGKALNTMFGTSFSRTDWLDVLTPPKTKTLRGVCELIASAATMPEIRPLVLPGKPCTTAGVFTVIRDLLAKQGADISDLHPSSEFTPYTRKYPGLFITELARIAPGAIPPVTMKKQIDSLCSWIALVSIVVMMISICLETPLLTIASVLALALVYLIFWLTATIEPDSVTFGNLRTFRDLCSVNAAQLASADNNRQ